MHAIACWLALLAAPFWQSKPPRDWSDAELKQLLSDSPWAQAEKGVTIVLATARPVRDAEAEILRRRQSPDAAADPEYIGFLQHDEGKHIVAAISGVDPAALDDPGEVKKMEAESILKVGKKKYPMAGHFPPAPGDPWLRLVFPREIGPGDKSLVLDLYLPGVREGYRTVEFHIKDLTYHGAPEM